MQSHPVASRDEWLKARKALLRNEKALTRMRDLISAERRALPWVKVEKNYLFDSPDGKKTLADLFGDNSQLIVHHFMFGPDWDAGCPSCSLVADHAEGALVHLVNHDVSLVRVVRAPVETFDAYNKRMGWTVPWASSHGSSFNFDYHVSFTKEELANGPIEYNYQMTNDGWDELPGLSVFFKNDAGEVFHTYSSYARSQEDIVATFMFLDLTPKGRNETEAMDWVRRHDEYDTSKKAPTCCHA